MKKTILLLAPLVLFSGCATGSYDTFRAREGGYDAQGITLNPVGLTADKLISTIDVQIQIFDDSAIRQARAGLFAEQGKALTQKMDALFAGAR